MRTVLFEVAVNIACDKCLMEVIILNNSVHCFNSFLNIFYINVVWGIRGKVCVYKQDYLCVDFQENFLNTMIDRRNILDEIFIQGWNSNKHPIDWSSERYV